MELSKAIIIGLVMSSQLAFAAPRVEKVEEKLSEILVEFRMQNFDIDREIAKQDDMIEEIIDREATKKALNDLDSDEKERIHVRLLNKESNKF